MKTWAVIVGINNYPAIAGQRRLKGAAADAADFADWALDPGGGNVDPSRLFFWTHPAPANPTQRVAAFLAGPTPWWDATGARKPPVPTRAPGEKLIVETALRAAAAARDERLEGDADEIHRVYLFLAGHGLQTNTYGSAAEIQTCFLAGDFSPSAMTVTGLIPCDDLRRALLAGGFDEVYMFLDCCRVAVTTLNEPAPDIKSDLKRQPPAPVFCVGNAAQRNRIAFETKARPVRGAFSKVLVEGLRTVRDADNQALTVEALKTYVYKNINAHAPEKQDPNIVADPDNPSPILLSGPPCPVQPVMAGIRVSFPNLTAGTPVQLSDDEGKPVGPPIVAGSRPVTLRAVTNRYYSLDLVGTTISTPFPHRGPGVTHVAL